MRSMWQLIVLERASSRLIRQAYPTFVCGNRTDAVTSTLTFDYRGNIIFAGKCIEIIIGIEYKNVTFGPESPGIPDGPIGPIGPGAPFSPGEPTSPGIPCLPSCPGRPSDPGGPGGPGGPGSPGSPCYVPRALRRYGFPLTRALDKSVSRCSSVLCHGRMGPEKEQRGVGVGQTARARRVPRTENTACTLPDYDDVGGCGSCDGEAAIALGKYIDSRSQVSN
uniref:Uncharacterized protein n=1 Tax=Vespula pensylvanica TaxID=30213 RepID=A0A834KT07_VESPE|nr:hypothetical protein H0235_013336 [Vespula pensylvanica]